VSIRLRSMKVRRTTIEAEGGRGVRSEEVARDLAIDDKKIRKHSLGRIVCLVGMSLTSDGERRADEKLERLETHCVVSTYHHACDYIYNIFIFICM
jgi:hypothetical protein